MSVSLVYPTWNRSPLLEKSLARLLELTLPDEIIVVDDGGEDGCDNTCNQFRDRGLPIRYIYNHQPFHSMCAVAKNIAIRNSDCDLMIFSEPEMFFVTDVVAQMLAARVDHPRELINAGKIHHEQQDGSPHYVTENWQALWIAMFERKWLLDVHGWDEHFPKSWGWDDVCLGTRLMYYGVGQYNDPSIEAIHQWHPPTQIPQDENEVYFRAKGFNEGRQDEIVANRNEEWGRIRCR